MGWNVIQANVIAHNSNMFMQKNHILFRPSSLHVEVIEVHTSTYPDAFTIFIKGAVEKDLSSVLNINRQFCTDRQCKGTSCTIVCYLVAHFKSLTRLEKQVQLKSDKKHHISTG